LHKDLIEKILFEIEQINKLLEIHNSLITLCRHKEPDSTELAAIGTILHSFYNGWKKYLFLLQRTTIPNYLSVRSGIVM
jgi:hypothetical protein